MGPRSSRPRARAPAPRRPVQSAPVRPASTQSTVPAPATSQGGGMLSGIGSTIAQGMAFGTGSAIAHRAVGAVANSFGGDGGSAEAAPQPVQQTQFQPTNAAAPQGPCGQDKQLVFECLQSSRGDQQACQFFTEALQNCMRDQNQ